MKNICFLIGNLNNSGGTERVTSLIANSLVEQGYGVSILSLVEGGSPFFEIRKEIYISSIHSRKVSMKKHYIDTILKIRMFVKTQKVDTLIVVDSISCIFTIPALLGLNLNHICWEHFNFLNNNNRKLRDIGRKLAVLFCSKVVTLTQKDMMLWKTHLKKIKAEIIAIPNPTPYENVKHCPTKMSKKILTVGRLTHLKGYDLLLNAWENVCKIDKEWSLMILGGGEEERKLKLQAQQLDISQRVIFIPETKNVEDFYKTSSFYCLSSRYEGLPMVLLEAQSFGLPVIAFNCNTGPSDIINHGENGFLVQDQDVKDLEKYLLEAINLDHETYNQFCENSQRRIRDFSIDRIINQWKKII